MANDKKISKNGQKATDKEPTPKRRKKVARTICAGCFNCYGNTPVWFGPNAHGVSVLHHDHTNHSTWVGVDMLIRYGEITRDHQPKMKHLDPTEIYVGSTVDLKAKKKKTNA